MKAVNMTSCCILYRINEMTHNHMSASMPYLIFHSEHTGIIMVERLIYVS